MTKKFEFNWQIPVPEPLLTGCVFDRWTEEKDNNELEPNCMFKVDEYGFFIYWKSEGREGDVIELCQVSDIRAGGMPKDMKLYNQLCNKHGENVEEKSLTICSGTDYININYQHVVCPDAATAKLWQQGLRDITHNIKMNNVCVWTNLMKHWMRLGFLVDPRGKVPVKVVARTFASGKTEKLVYQILSDLGLPSGKNDVIEKADFTFEKFYELYHKICPRNDIEELFRSITQGKANAINLDQFINFLNEKQRDPRLNEILYPLYDEKRALEIITTYEQNDEAREAKTLTKDGLIRYLMSDENAPVFLDRLDIYMDMDQPLSHYYINSSHNTYLSGRQFGGKSSVEMYRQTLLAGCRCVELDCWDGKGEDEEPIITHGMAMCTDILFKDVIYALRDTAFVTSDYPVILSFENHCCKSQQYKLAKYCDEILGDLLLKEPIPDYPLEPGAVLPPPSLLKRKILIKNKRLKPEVEKKELELFLQGEFVIEDEVKEDASAVDVTKIAELEAPAAAAAVVPVAAAAASQDGGEEAPPIQYTGSTTNVHPWLSSMVNYAQPVKFQSFDYADKKNVHHNMSSFAETTGMNLLKSQAIEFVNYNKRQMSRIYPKGTRADSSNYMPQVFWNAGCQMVSLNFQTSDLPMQLNQGKFEYNGNCGYLLKPDFMRRADRSFDPFADAPVDGVIAASCAVQVIAGQFLSDKKVGTYVEVDMYGLPSDTVRKEFRTRMVPANGLNPVYNEEPFLFRKVVLPDLAVLRFGVYDENGKLLGQRILPLDGLQGGYRHISLRTEANFPMSLPMLFCNIELKIYVPDGFEDFMDALSDPRAFMGAAKERSDNMKAMGIEETGKKDKEEAARKEEQRVTEPPLVFDPITVDSLRQEKGFQKTAKKQQKELDAVKKKHAKERAGVQKQQNAAIERLVKGKSKEEIKADPAVRKLIQEQNAQWTEMAERHKKEEWELLKQQLADQQDILRKLMETTQAAQMKQLEAKHEREIKELNSRQAKISVETSKEVANDKTLKTKGEKDRRLREKKQNNIKRFMDEKKTATIKQNREKEKLKVTHDKQLEELANDVQKLSANGCRLISSGSSSSTSINVEQKSTSGSSSTTTTTSAPPVPFRSFSTIPPPSAQHLIRLNTIEEARKREEAKQSACPCICS
ncbi:1-phosphatidylinositol 4,5-bisphosphate phosphodiesterase isoform X1 [Anopheles arabiensis]|uniref:1-phosphatidylinositol 4,5-bisphosphate phosphodiesterase isoform X1 n=1 Tax=Anopheles arabiensis TaxID=7173 RepID=UPI001AAC5437|nr:1-phosphatidylinositol 4,5-bisphosphate phosphodiesterase isoform X1 [Anopheles arabiensis]XP_040158952.1 1-phosphatidylinositol 4,5-bisphosphate phosphodiesterase isoform X1 [Anopheles arabiensis]XP_040158953.1 1-phosphatidylinositol 4,5-bisphosphate phosphodiesterase isoform X1 [Anopheles arabiensis]XP_040158954.1 1-phosphatidylinositol 4,5-bisphosphate phosphodiesterase isoform X1 [Anopheles arabiensis]XP_040158955.1 1-phosphatidylinositol 4,5-bisphosphate phosphodiesterase isoform X1 [An